MKTIVLGGCGIIGLSLLTYLKEQRDISEIVVTDVQERKLKEEVAWLNDKDSQRELWMPRITMLWYPQSRVRRCVERVCCP